MRSRTAVRTGIDVAKLGAAVARPGIDPRVWLTLAVVTELGFDADEGPFADVQYQPNGDKETALICSNYAGNEFGDWASLETGDTVLVAVPMGDPGYGPMIIARAWNAGDKPYSEMGEGETPSADRIIRVKSGQKFRVLIDGDAARIELAQADQSFVRGEDFADTFDDLADASDDFAQGVLQAFTKLLPVGPPTTPVLASNVTLAIADITAAYAQYAAAVAQAKAARNTYLSTKIKGE